MGGSRGGGPDHRARATLSMIRGGSQLGVWCALSGLRNPNCMVESESVESAQSDGREAMQAMIIFAQSDGGGGGGIGSIIVLLILAAIGYAGFRAYQAHKEETSESRTVKSLPPSIQHVVIQMDRETQNAFFNEYERKKKKKAVGWFAWLFFAWHYLYVGKVGMQFAFWFTWGGFWIWWIVDLFRMPSIIRSANEEIARTAIQTLGIAASFGRDAGPQDMGGVQEGNA